MRKIRWRAGHALAGVAAAGGNNEPTTTTNEGEKNMNPVTSDVLKTLQDKVSNLVADKSDADAKTVAANAANTAAAQANAVAAPRAKRR